MARISQNKTVYILGAGFSRDAYFPLQNEIIPRIKKLSEEIAGEPIRFIESVFGTYYTPSLEDIFTLLDQAILKRDNLGGIVHSKLDEIRDKLIRSILYLLHSCSDNFFNITKSRFEPLTLNENTTNYDSAIKIAREFYKTNSAYFVKERILNGLSSDTFSIISLNWDTLIEDSIYSIKKQINHRKIDIDYCCYTNPLTKSSRHTNSLIQKSRNIFNIKILKLHSSSNWLVCPNCGRLFTGIGSKENTWELYLDEVICPKCKIYSKRLSDEYPILSPFLLTPTFLKKIDQNPHINVIWHNAFVELSEANKIVIIGYSLPDSDYLLRTLLKRSISEHIQIEVVLTENDVYKKQYKSSLKNYFAAERYKAYFSQYDLTIYTQGVMNYFKTIHGTNSSQKIITEINDL